MLAVLAIAVVIWSMGRVLRLPGQVVGALVVLLWLAVVVINLTLPQGAPLRLATGGDARTWLVLGAVVALALAYGGLLRRLRGRALKDEAARAPAAPDAPFSPTELERYARHILLREVGGAGQRKLKAARVLVVGAGGLGSSALLYLAAAGVGTIGVIDDDVIEGSNLQRQIIHTDARIGMPKVFSAQAQMEALNPFVNVRPYRRRLDESTADQLFAEYDLILDGSDNFETRYLVNRMAARHGKPLIAAAMTQWEGQIGLYDPARGGPCYACVFPVPPAPGLVPSCAEAGVIAPLPGVIGSMMALEAVKHLCGAGQGLRGALVIHDALDGETRRMKVGARSDCAVCGTQQGAAVASGEFRS